MPSLHSYRIFNTSHIINPVVYNVGNMSCLIPDIEIQQLMDKKPAAFRPYGMHGRSGFSVPVLPYMRMCPGISFLMISGGKHPCS